MLAELTVDFPDSVSSAVLGKYAVNKEPSEVGGASGSGSSVTPFEL